MTNVIVSNRGIVHAIGGIEDHVHVLMEMPRDKALSDLMRSVKTNATHWLKRENPSRYSDFEWQVGYGAFSTSCSSIEDVKKYIGRQEIHHRKKDSNEEWNDFLEKGGYRFCT